MSSPPAQPLALLEAQRARIVVDDVVVVQALSLTTAGDRVLLVGHTAPLFGALSGAPLRRQPEDADALREGSVRISAGDVLVVGKSVARGEHRDVAASAPFELPVPAKMTGRDYLTWVTRLRGLPAKVARTMAERALERLGHGAIADKKLASFSRVERRLLGVAMALAPDPEVAILESPLAGLEAYDAAHVLAAVATATEGRRAIVSASRLEPGTGEASLLAGADELVVIAEGEVVAQGAPTDVLGGARVYRLTCDEHVEELRAELAERGIQLSGGPRRFAVSLPEGTSPAAVVRAAAAVDAPITELLPMFGA